MKIKASVVFDRNYNAKARNVVNEGSARSSKTYSLCQLFIIRLLEKKRIATICREKATWVKATVMIDFYDVLTNHFNLYNPKNENKTDKTYTFDNGSMVRFIGTDEHQKLHGMKQDLAWLNESIEISYDSYRQIAIRTTEQIFLDLNPSVTSHWIFDKVLTRDDSEHIHSTYKSNPFLSKEIISEIERLEPTEFNISQGTADEVLWKIYGLGVRASHQGLIFPNIKICKELPPKEHWKKTAIGLDFGFTNDPSAIVRMVLSQGELYFDQIAYKRGMLNTQNKLQPNLDNIETELRDNIEPNERIWADGAEPKSIRELQLAGFNIQAATKGPDSVLNGINLIKGYNCYITERSVDLIKEKNNYVWVKDKQTGKAANKPVDAYNHCFTGNQMVLTKYGYKKIKNIKIGDIVINSYGENRVLQIHENGIKQVARYKIYFKDKSVVVESTENHLIRTDEKWTEISNIKKGSVVYLLSSLTEESIINTKTKDTTQGDVKDCTESYGSLRMVKYPKDMRFTTKMATRATMIYQILKSYTNPITCLITPKNIVVKIQKGLKSILIQLGIRRVNGMHLQKAGSGTKSIMKKCPTSYTKKKARFAGFVKNNLLVKNIKKSVQGPVIQKKGGIQGLTTSAESAQPVKIFSISANIQSKYVVHQRVVEKIEILKRFSNNVFDIGVDTNHEYVVNGILVHNCFDACSYASRMELPEARNKPYKAIVPSKMAKEQFTSAEDKIKYWEQKNKYQRNF